MRANKETTMHDHSSGVWPQLDVTDTLSSEAEMLQRPDALEAFPTETDRDSLGAPTSAPTMSRSWWVQAYLQASSMGATHEAACEYADAAARLPKDD